MSAVTVHPCLELFKREIERFRTFARQRASADGRPIRRRHKRYHRSWPLSVATYENGCFTDHSAALYDASEAGIGYMCDQLFEKGSLVYVRLFWHEAGALRIPAIVRHVTPGPSGILVGVEFALDDAEACETALQMDQQCRL